MSLENFPIVCWQLEDEMILGKVLGLDITVIEPSNKKVKKTASDRLQKLVKDEVYIDSPEIQEPELRVYKVPVQLSYREDWGNYPLASQTDFKVAAIHSGEKFNGFGECYLPSLDIEFYYYSREQRTDLIKHYTRQFLQDDKPEDAYQYIMSKEPWLESISVRTDSRRAFQAKKSQYPKLLLEVSDFIPTTKMVRKQITRLPETAWERSSLVSDCNQFLLKGNGNCLLVGGRGVGKSLLWQEAAKIIARSEDSGDKITIWRTNSRRLVGKAKYLGEWQAICDEVVEALAQVNGVLWLTDIISLMTTGGEGAEDSIAAYLFSFIKRGQLRIIGELIPQELEVARAKLPAFIQQFKIINVEELDKQATKAILKKYVGYIESNFDVSVTSDALELGLQLVSRYLKYEKSPGNSLRFFSTCLKNLAHQETKVMDRGYILNQFIEYTGLPLRLLDDSSPLMEQELLQYFGERIIGQDTVLKQLSRTVQLFKAGLNDPDKPIATLLFAGPTGVGKTAATKALAEFFFSAGQKKNPLFSIDMSEFQHPSHIVRLIGDHSQPGKLVSHVRSQPFSVVLLDEIEKAHSSIYDALLTVLDEGILTDRAGRVTDFRSCIIIMTTNLGVKLGNALSFVNEPKQAVSIAAIKQYFRPEFFNRIDYVLSFNSLDRHAILAITARELKLLHQRDRIKQQNIQLSFSDSLIEYIANTGFSPAYGARPIQRAIEKEIVTRLSRLFIENLDISQVSLDYIDNTVVIT